MPTLTVTFQISFIDSPCALGLVFHPRYRDNKNVMQAVKKGCAVIGEEETSDFESTEEEMSDFESTAKVFTSFPHIHTSCITYSR
jgi:hypothetical protein